VVFAYNMACDPVQVPQRLTYERGSILEKAQIDLLREIARVIAGRSRLER